MLICASCGRDNPPGAGFCNSYPGDQHYFADSSLPSYDESATRLLTQRVLGFLERVS